MRSPIVDWLIRIDTDEEWDADLLITHFQSDECKVFKEPDNCYYLRSDQFKGVQDHKQVIATARPLMEHINGVAKIIAPWSNPANFDKLVSIHENGNRGIVILVGPIEFRIPAPIPPRTVLAGISPSIDRADAFIRLAKDHQNVAKALRIYGSRPPTWSNPYNIFEIVREDMDGQQQVIDGGLIGKRELKRFTGTANDPMTVGDEARHQKGSRSNKMPKLKPMPHEEAKTLLHSLLKNWLELKAKK